MKTSKKSFLHHEKKMVRRRIQDNQLKQYNNNLLKKMTTDYAKYYNNETVKHFVILYEAFEGCGMLCNSNGLFRAFMQRDDFEKYKHVWVIKDLKQNQIIIQEYRKYKNIRFIEYLGKEYLYYLACAKILVNNKSFPVFFTKKEDQIYINTWHGISLEKVGYDEENGSFKVANTIRNFLCTDYLISSCNYQKNIYKRAFKLDGIFPGRIISEGQPRSDLLWNSDRSCIIEKMKRCGVNIDVNRKLILFVLDGKEKKDSNINVEEYFECIRILENGLPKNEYQVLMKLNQIVYQQIKEDDRIQEKEILGKLVPSVLDTNEILSVTDILISDYSNVYFDFMVTDRPILFYISNIDQYNECPKNQKFAMPLDDLPGPITNELTTIVEWVLSIEQVKKDYFIKYKEQKAKFIVKEDGKVSERIWNIIFGDCYDKTDELKTNKKKILAYIGEVKVNGITESFFSLTNAMNFDKFDISVILIAHNEPEILKKLTEIHPNVRVLSRVGKNNATIKEATDNIMVMEYSLKDSDIKKYYSENFYYKEYRRNFGDAKFDYVINYTGYSAFYGVLLLQAKEAKKYVWQHSDILKDKDRNVNGEKINEKPLKTVFSTYPFYDKIVSCSESVMNVNRKSVATKKTYDKFTYCRNMVNFSRVIDGLNEDSVIVYNNVEYYAKTQKSIVTNDKYSSIKMVRMPKRENMNFVTMGRISPEKNYENMIRAFAKFNREYSNSMLYILGDGPLMPAMQKLIRDEFCVDSVILLGNMANPFSFMKECNCFILPSFYEGQPMVLLEARAVGLPIIVSNFSTVADSLIENGQFVIEHHIQSIYEGFVTFAKGKIPNVKFDFNQYNRNAYLEFEKLFEDKERNNDEKYSNER